MMDHQAMTDPQDDVEDWYQAATRELSLLSRTVRSQDALDLTALAGVAKGMIASLSRSETLVVQALSAPMGDRLIANLVHVGILAARIGLGLDYSGRQLEQLTLAGLLHDRQAFGADGHEFPLRLDGPVAMRRGRAAVHVPFDVLEERRHVAVVVQLRLARAREGSHLKTGAFGKAEGIDEQESVLLRGGGHQNSLMLHDEGTL